MSLATLNPQLRERFENLLKSQGFIGVLQYLAPLDVSFKILSKTNFKGIKHDIAILFRFDSAEVVIKDPRDIQAVLYQLLAERKSDLKVTADKGRYDDKDFFVIFIDRP